MMKLICCHMENYGRFKDKKFDFSEGLSVFCENNGYGKTTLASFIKAMFYGLPSYTSKSRNFDDRQRFYPFDGGKFGGSITFEKSGKIYRVERFFDKKSSVRDEVRVFCGGNIYGGFGDNIGKAVFGLDEEAFARTVFLTAEQTETFATAGINAKLNNYVDDTDDDNNFETALAKLKAAKKNYKAERGAGGLISSQKQEIAGLRDEIANLEEIERGVPALYEKRAVAEKELKVLEEEESKSRASEILNQQWETYSRYVNEAETEKEKLSAADKKYPAGLPGGKELDELNAVAAEKFALEAELKAGIFGIEKEMRFKELSGQRFFEGVPCEEELAAVRNDIEEEKLLGIEIDKLENEKPSQRERELEEKFGGVIPGKDAVEKYEELIDGYRRAEIRANALPSVAAGSVQPVKLGKNAKIILIVISVIAGLALIAGGALIAFYTIAGIISLCFGGVLAIAVGFAYLIIRMNAISGAQSVAVNADAAAAKAEMEVIKEKVRAYLVRYGFYSENGIIYDFASFKTALGDYMNYIKSKKERENIIEKKVSERVKLSDKTKEFLYAYGDFEGYDNADDLNTLRSYIKEFCALSEERANSDKVTAERKSKINRCDEIINRVFKKYEINADGGVAETIRTLERDCLEYERLTESVKYASIRAENYKKDKKLTVRPEISDNAANIAEVLSEKRNYLASLDRQIAGEEEKVEVLADKRNRLEIALETLESYKRKHKLLEAAETLLSKAEQNLKEKYVAPVRDRFLHYAQTIESALGEKIEMDKDYKIRFERGGELRDDRHFSAGQRSICALCLRLALIDNMYVDEEPFVIMDDPFVHLDGEHMKRTAETVRKLAGEKQIIYFCCHESRLI